MESTLLEVISTATIPVVTAILGWVGNAYRNKQAKERDIMANVKEMMDIQNDFISRLKSNIDERDTAIAETRQYNQRLEARLNRKDRVIRRANFCKFTNEGEGCPVLNQEEMDCHEDICINCEHRDDTNKNQNW